MSLPHNQNQIQHARSLRKAMTKEERHLWYDFLRNYSVKVYRQKVIGSYIVDFYCESAKLVIELDGSQHCDENGRLYDAQRTAYLNSLGLMVVRYSNLDVQRQFGAVCEALDLLIKQRMQDLHTDISHRTTPRPLRED